jgi:glycosyltransferase involved in cell wall biosynthesis
MPSMLAGRCREAGVPFVVGPLNGGVPWPRQFDSARRKENEWLSYVRDGYKLLPGYHSTRRNASAILIGSRDTWEQMPRQYHRRCVYIPENAIDPARFARVRTRRAEQPLRAVFVGRLVPYKGADMLIEAAAPLIRGGQLRLDILGDGPQMGLLKELARREKLEDGLTLRGWVAHHQLQDHLVEADLFTFPSIREFGGAVVLEAMAVGLVPIVIDYGGPAELVTTACGFRVPMGSREQIIQHVRQTLHHAISEPELIDGMSYIARARAHGLFTWDAKARQVMEVYRWVLEPGRPKPEFGMPLPDERGFLERVGRERAGSDRVAAAR